jgi:hypothetical protein
MVKKELPKPEPALFRHSCTLYEALLENSAKEDVSGHQYDVFRGYLTDAFNGARISQQYYPAVFALLSDYECIAILSRGARNTPSCVVLLQHPKDANVPDEAKIFQRDGRSPLTRAADFDKLAQRVDNLARSVGGVNLVELVSTVANLEKRIQQLEVKEAK